LLSFYLRGSLNATLVRDYSFSELARGTLLASLVRSLAGIIAR